MNSTPTDDCFIRFTQLKEDTVLPDTLGYPFYYTPHPLAIQAAHQLQEIIQEKSIEWQHNFGLINEENAIGKMFGVLVVQNQQQEVGFLAGFSGKLADKNDHLGFVPPVFDMLRTNSHFRKEEQEIHKITLELESLLEDPSLIALQEKITLLNEKHQQTIAETKQQIKRNKKERDARRKSFETLTKEEFNTLLEQLANQSKQEQLALKHLNKQFSLEREQLATEWETYQTKLTFLKEERKSRSATLQQHLFEQYTFLNKDRRPRSLLSIFSEKELTTPPAGAGECSAPKLFQYAFEKGYQPLALAEFWWGKSPASEIRVHRQFYPACRGKCEPILAHMLEGLPIEPNPMLELPDSSKELILLYEDDQVIAVNKPTELLSVPGKSIKDSVQERLKTMFPDTEGPFLVHRLDMSTSGVLIAAKTMDAYRKLQRQFIKHHVRKTYIALVEGVLEHSAGCIHFPMRVNLDDRPRQLACFTYGKDATTKWIKLDVANGLTRVEFEPITGRTHQLRVHSAHKLGLNCPIKGDDLYGKKADRLYLHAHQLTFTHPLNQTKLTVTAPIPF
jgi:tRNA pseudouridine32 synthase/23S rRNA pseudouridine746 synthase